MRFQFLTMTQLWLVVCHLSRQRLDTVVASLTANDEVLFDSVYLISLCVLHTFDKQPIPFFVQLQMFHKSRLLHLCTYTSLISSPSASYITSQKSAKHFEFVNTHFLHFLCTLYPTMSQMSQGSLLGQARDLFQPEWCRLNGCQNLSQ